MKVTIVPNWRTSSYTSTENCVEVADNDPHKVLIRDSKNRNGETLTFSQASWMAFVEFSKHQTV